LADDEEFRDYVKDVRNYHALGGRISRKQYDLMISERDHEWLEHESDFSAGGDRQ
jgi:hypothetical protein